MCGSPWSHKVLDTIEWLNKERIHGELRDHDKNAAEILSVSLRRNRQDIYVGEKKKRLLPVKQKCYIKIFKVFFSRETSGNH